MSPAISLDLNARACNRCGSCERVCPTGAIKVGRTYLKVDSAVCLSCGACARSCAKRAITIRGASGKAAGKRTGAVAPERPKPAPRESADTPRSRSMRKQEEAAARAEERKEIRAERSAMRKTTAAAKIAKRQEAMNHPAVPPRGGSRGGFQWSLLETAAMLSVTFAAFALKETLPFAPIFHGMPARYAPLLRVGTLALYYAIQVAVLVWLVRRRGGDPASALGLSTRGTTGRHVLSSAWLVLIGLAVTRLGTSSYAYLTRSLGLMPSATTDLPTLFGSDTTGFVLAIVMVVLVGPVVEEAVFRGALMEGLAARLGPWPAIIIQALLFAAFHRSLWLLAPMFLLGVVLGWLADRRENLWPSISLHAVYNAMTVVAAFLVAGK